MKWTWTRLISAAGNSDFTERKKIAILELTQHSDMSPAQMKEPEAYRKKIQKCVPIPCGLAVLHPHSIEILPWVVGI